MFKPGAFVLISVLAAVAAAAPALLPVPEAPLDTFEPGVRAAITQARSRIEGHKREPAVSQAANFGRLGMLFHAHDLSDLAAPCYINAKSLAPQDFRWPYLLAYLYQVDGELEKAEYHYKLTLELKPDFLPARLHLGQTLNALEKADDAGRVFAAALQADPGNAVALEGLGNLAFRSGNYESAIGYFEQALKTDPQADRLYYMLGMAHRKLGNVDDARRYLSLRGTRNPAITDPILAEVQALQNNSQEHIKRGLAAYNAGRYGEAAKAYRQALESAPGDHDTRLALAWVLELEGDDAAALQEVERVLAAAPESAKAHYMKGALLAKADLNREAVAHLRKAVSLEPDAATPRLVLATTLMRSAEFTEAEQHYGVLASRQPDDAVLLYRLGLARLAAGRCQQAIEPLENALRIRANSLTVIQALLRTYSICPDQTKGHAQTALIQAQRVFDQIKRWDSAETLAMALASNDRFGDAAQLQQTVIDEARRAGTSMTIMQSLNRNLDRYRSREPANAAWPNDADVFRPPALSATDRLALDG